MLNSPLLQRLLRAATPRPYLAAPHARPLLFRRMRRGRGLLFPRLPRPIERRLDRQAYAPSTGSLPFGRRQAGSLSRSARYFVSSSSCWLIRRHAFSFSRHSPSILASASARGGDRLGALAVGCGARRACRIGGLEPDRKRLVLVGAADEAAAGALGGREAACARQARGRAPCRSLFPPPLRGRAREGGLFDGLAIDLLRLRAHGRAAGHGCQI